MAPVGKVVLSGKDFTKNSIVNVEKTYKELDEGNGVKEEPPGVDAVHEVDIKVEEDVANSKQGEAESLVLVNEAEDLVVKKKETSEDSSDDEDNKLEIDLSNAIDCKVGKNDESDKEETNKVLVCKICGKSFSRVFHYQQHMNTHKIAAFNNLSDNKPYKCPECGKGFAQFQHLVGHSRIHIAGKYYECPICRRKFTELSNLSMHLLKTHPDEKPYKCSKCDKQFTQSSALKKHMRIHWSTVQDELDQIDTMFLIDDGTEKELEEPLKKKIRMEKDESKSTPLKEKVSFVEIKEGETTSKTERTVSSKEKLHASREWSLLGNGSSNIEITSPVNKTSLVKETSSAKNMTLSVTVPSRKSSHSTLETSLVSKDIARLLKESQSPADVTSSSLKESLTTGNPKSVLAQENDIAPVVRACPSKVISQEGNIKEPLKISQSKDPFGVRNGVPLDQVQSPQIKVTKYEKKSNDSTSEEIKRILNAPAKFVLGSTELNNSSKDSKQIEASKELDKSNVESASKEKKWEKQGPFPFDENSDQSKVERQEANCDVRFKCHRCEIFFETEEKLHDHLMFHASVKLLECRFCGKDFTKMSSLKKHLFFHVIGSIPQDCTRCGKSFTTFRDLKDHTAGNKCNSSSSSRFKCFRCRKFTSSLKKLKVHLLSQCNEEPVKYYFKKNEESNEHSESDVKAPGSDLGQPPTENTSTNNLCESGKQTSKEEWMNQKFEKRESLSSLDMQSLPMESNDIEALQILNEFSSNGPIKEKEKWLLQCQSCDHKSENVEEAKSHSKLCDMKKPESISERDNLKIKVVFEEDRESMCFLNCSECEKTIVGVEKMLLHIKEHMLERNTLVCPVLKCEKMFKDPKDFKMHLKAHTGHKPYKCHDCGKRFFLRDNYEEHAKRHGVMKNWSSSGINLGGSANKAKRPAESPSTIESSITNLEVLEADVDRKFKWTPHMTTQPTCNRAEFKSYENKNKKEDKVQKEVKKAVQKTSPVPILPALSAASFTISSPASFTIVTSPISFTATSPGSDVSSEFSISSAKQGFSQKDSSTRLQYYRITENSRDAIQAANAELRKYPRSGRCDVCKKFCSRLDKHMMVHLNQKPHLCPVCPQAFRQSEHLRRHIRARHEGDHRQFECPQCHKRLTRKDKLKEHMKICCRSLTVTMGATLGDSLFDMIPGPNEAT